MNQFFPNPAACWLWPKFNYNAQNAYAGFRHDFEMQTLPSAAPFIITADQSYRLWVNGHYVCRGPLRGHQENWYYDTVDLLPFLKIGKNWISIEAHNPGISHYSYTYKDKAGFLCSGIWDNGTEIVSRLSDWLVFRNTAYNSYTGRLSVQTGFQEELDLRIDNRSWITEAENYAIPPQRDWFEPESFAQGSLPWTNLLPRPTEMLEEKYTPAAELIAFGTGVCCKNPPKIAFEENNFIRDFALFELPSIHYCDTLPETQQTTDAISFVLPAAKKNGYSAVLLDMGRLEWLPGTAELEVNTEDADAILDLAFLHYVPENKISFASNPARGCLVAPGARFHLKKKYNAVSCFQISGTRWATLILRGNTAAVSISFRWRSAVSPINIKGNFQCSDPVFNDIYAISAHTQRCCSMDAFVDTPWREQSQWWGDARVQAKNVFFLSGDTRLLEQGIRSIAGQPGPEGLLFANAPTKACGPILPDYCLTWIHTLYDLYFQTGRLELFEEYKAQAEQILAYFERTRSEGGLLRYDKRFWLFEDWSTLPKRNTPAFLNLLYYYTRLFYKKLLEAAGFDTETAQLHADLERDKKLLIQGFLDEKQGLFVPEINEKGEQTGVPSVHDQVLALLCDLCPEQKDSMLKKRIIPCLKGELNADISQPSSFWATYLLQAAEKEGIIQESLAYLKKGWEPMIATGTTWEHFAEPQYTSASVCHAWSGHPVYHLPELFFGVHQNSPCWEILEITPRFLVENAAFEIPLPQGVLSCHWENDSFRLELPAGIKAKLHLDGETLIFSGPTAFEKNRKQHEN